MNAELHTLLQRWREDILTEEDLRALTALLAESNARAAMRRDWFLEAALPQALAAAEVIARTPETSLAARMRGRITAWLTRFAPPTARGEEPTLAALRVWARASYAALALGLVAAGWFTWPQREALGGGTDSEPADIARIMLETQLPYSP